MQDGVPLTFPQDGLEQIKWSILHYSARSPDLSPLDFHLGGFLKDQVGLYSRRPSLTQLRNCIKEETATISFDSLPEFFQKFQKRPQLLL